MWRKISCLLVSAVLTLGCSSMGSTPRSPAYFEEASLGGMVYTLDGRPVRGARILIDGSIETRTDINGRFISEPISAGIHKLIIRKAGYEAEELTIDFSDRLQVLYVRLVSFEYLLEEAELQIDTGDLFRARSLLDRAEKIREDDPALLMLYLVIAIKSGDETKSKSLSRRLSAYLPPTLDSPLDRGSTSQGE